MPQEPCAPQGHPGPVLLRPRRLHGSPVPPMSGVLRKAARVWLPSHFQAKGKFLSGMRSLRGLGSAAEGGGHGAVPDSVPGGDLLRAPPGSAGAMLAHPGAAFLGTLGWVPPAAPRGDTGHPQLPCTPTALLGAGRDVAQPGQTLWETHMGKGTPRNHMSLGCGQSPGIFGCSVGKASRGGGTGADRTSSSPIAASWHSRQHTQHPGTGISHIKNTAYD